MPSTMGLDLCDLMRRDHDDLDRALDAMCDPATAPKELVNLVEVLRLALAIHMATEAHVLDLLLARIRGPRVLRLIASQSRIEHAGQCGATERLLSVRPGCLAWYQHANAVRELVNDHAWRAERTRWTLHDHVPADLQRMLASEYASERMRVLASTSPLVLAQRRTQPATLH